MRWLNQQIAPDFGEIVAQRLHDLKSEAETPDHKFDYTYKGVAYKIGFRSQTSIKRIVSGTRVTLLRPAQFWKLAEVLGFDAEVMLEAAGYLPVSTAGATSAKPQTKPRVAKVNSDANRTRRQSRARKTARASAGRLVDHGQRRRSG